VSEAFKWGEMENPRTARDTQFEAILGVIDEEDLRGQELTASEIHDIAKDDASLSSPHEVATVLGHHSEDPDIEVKEGSPYRYEFR
jgi:hypothetical protein